MSERRRGGGDVGGAWGADELREIDEELAFHLEGRVEALMAEGVAEAEARTRALRAFGDVGGVRAEMSRIEAERRVTILELHHLPADHPVPPAFNEGRYLKLFLCRVE